MSVRAYSAYRESGIEWIGRIPSHWEACKLKHAIKEFGSGGTPDTSDPASWTNDGSGYAWVAIADMSNVDVVKETAKAITDKALSERRLKVWPTGTLIFSMYASLGHVAQLLVPAAINQALLALVPQETHSQHFIRWWLQFLQPRLVEQANSNTQDNLNAEKVRNLPCVQVSIVEQSAITSFLDRETGKIDALVAEQERLIELLKEKRQAVISQAVTKGLDPNAPMKDSGVEWLGEVPAHWKVGRCGYYIDILSGFAFPSEGFSSDEANVRLLRGLNIGVGKVRWNETVYWRRGPGDRLDRYELSEGDLVLGMDRPWIADGVRVAMIREEDLPCLLLQRVARISTGAFLKTDYIFWLLAADFFIHHFGPEFTGVSVPHISPEQIADFQIPLPPIAEQQAIVRHIGERLLKLDELNVEAERAITLLQERRAALISAAVTGKIDVRDLAVQSEAQAA